MKSRSLDIIVPIYKNAALVEACVSSILRHLPEIQNLQPRLVLINDSPDDEPVELVLRSYERSQSNIIIIRNSKNLGFVQTVNKGLAIALKEGRDVVLVNSDTVTFPGTLLNIINVAAADPQISFVTPRSNNASICSLPHFHGGSIPDPDQAYKRWLTVSKTMPTFHFSPTAVGFYMFIAHRILANHGGLREDFGLGYEEENDLVMRAGKVGERAAIANQAFAYHAGSASFLLLNELDLINHKKENLSRMTSFHPEFLTLVKRYEDSPHFRAERLMSGLLPDQTGRTKIVFDLTGIGQHHNGTNEVAVAVLKSMTSRWAGKLRVTGLCSLQSFQFHGLDKVQGLLREDPDGHGIHAVAVRLGQPFDLHHLNVLEKLAPVTVFAMLDTIAEDCGPLLAAGHFVDLWNYVASHANGLIFISDFSEATFCNRHPDAREQRSLTKLLPTRLSSYVGEVAKEDSSHVLVLGNHYPHKGSDSAARAISVAFPTIKVIVLGSESFQRGNLVGYRSGNLDQETIDELFNGASAVVLPSYVEGFGFGFMHALSRGRPIAARRIPATEEILATLDNVEGVFLFDYDTDIVNACLRAMSAKESTAKDFRASGWDEWSDAVAKLCLECFESPNVFDKLVSRISAGDSLRRSVSESQVGTTTVNISQNPVGADEAKPMDLASMLKLEDKAFVAHAYATLLCRPADASGFLFYVKELEKGVEKLEILKILSTSEEGRARGVDLKGLQEMLSRHGSFRRPLLQRILNASRVNRLRR